MKKLFIFFTVFFIGLVFTKNQAKQNQDNDYQLSQYEKVINKKTQDKVVLTYFKGFGTIDSSSQALNPQQVSEMKEEDTRHLLKKLNLKKKDVNMVKHIYGLQIPDKFECTKDPYLFLECRIKDWKSKQDKTKYLCDLFGENRGRCQHVDENDAYIDQMTLIQELNRLSIVHNWPVSPEIGKHWQIDFGGYKKRLCKKWTCSEWHKYRPDKFNCTIIQKHAFCYNESLDMKRDCTQGSQGWNCKNYFYENERKLELAFNCILGNPDQPWPKFR